MQRLIAFALFLLMESMAHGAAFVNGSGTNGNFSDGAIWVGGIPPTSSNDSFTIGGQVNYDTNNEANGWAASVVNGTLDITNGVAGVWSTNCVYLKLLGNLSGTGNFFIGRSATPVPHVGTNPAVVVAFTSGGITMTKAGGIQWYGEGRGMTNGLWSSLAVAAAVGTNIIYLTTNIDVRAGDVISVGSYSQGANATLHVVASVSGTTVTLDPTTNYFGNQQGALQTNITTTARSNTWCGVTVLTRPILAMDLSSAGTLALVGGASVSNTLAGVRVYRFQRFINAACNYWTATNFVFQSGVYLDNGGSYFRLLSSVVWGCSYANAGTTTGSECLDSVAIHSPLAWPAGVFNSVVENSANDYILGSANSVATSCTVYNASGNLLGDADTASSAVNNNVFRSVRAVHSKAFIGSERGANNLFIGCSAVLSTEAGFMAGSGGRALEVKLIGCVASNNIGANFANIPFGLMMLECTNQSALAPVSSYLYSSVGNAAATVWKSSSLWSYYCAGGVCSSQTAVVSGQATGFTMRHLSEVAGYQSRWYDDSTVRPYGTARYTVYLRRETNGMDHRACIVRRPYDPAADSWGTPSLILACYTNVASTGAWETVDLSWYNTNSYPIDVRINIGCTGAVNSVAYSGAVKQDDRSLRIMP